MHGITMKQARAIEALRTSATVKEAARKAGVHPDSISRWRREPAFLKAMQEVTPLLMAAALVDVATDPHADAVARVAAAKAILRGL